MNTRELRNDACRGLFTQCLALASIVSLSCCTLVASAQINRSRPASPPASSGGGGHVAAPNPASSSSIGSSRSNSGRTPSASLPSFPPRGGGDRTPGISVHGSVPRSGHSSADRFNRTEEGAAYRDRSRGLHGYIGPYYPYGYFPDYSPYGYPSYPSFPYPGPDYRYPEHTDRPIADRFDSPYYFCPDLGAPYVNGSTVIIAKPKKLYAPIPVYRDGVLQGWRDLGAGNYLADRNVDSSDYKVRESRHFDPALDAAVADIQDSWNKADVEPLARHVRADTPVAIIVNGKYLYSLEAGDLLEATRSAFSSAHSPKFVADHLHQRADGIYALTGRHIYTDNQGHDRTAYFTYVLEESDGDFILTQLAAAADRE